MSLPEFFPADVRDAKPALFDCVLQQTGSDAAWLTLTGELDLSSSWYLATRLDDAFASAGMVVVDLRRVAFMDCAGLAVIAASDAQARRSTRRLVVVRGSRQTERLLEVTGLLNELEVTDFQLMASIP
jgi:anti-anti-sigma factor